MADRAIVVGGGIIGLATCFELAERGLDVTLMDPNPASGATHHAGGMLAPVAEVQYRQEPLIPLMLRSAELYPDLLERVSQWTDLPIGHRAEGTLVLAADRADARHLSDLSDYQELHGMTAQRMPLKQVRALEPALTPRLAGAVHIPDDHQIAPRDFATALLAALNNRGVKILREKLTHVDNEPGVQVILSNGLGAAHVTGWYRGANPLQLRPVYGDILRLGVPEHLHPLLDRVIRAFVEDRPVYLIPRSDRTLAIGATSREDDRAVPRAGAVHDLLRDAIRLVPGIQECDLIEASVGARPGTPDDLPYLGRVRDNLIISTGYFRHGILLAALGAQVAADLAIGKTPNVDLTDCQPLRHQRTSS